MDSLLPPVVAVLTANILGFKAGMAEAKASMESLQAGKTEQAIAGLTNTFALVGTAATAVGGVAVKMAADFEQATNRLITSAGESASNLDMVKQGIMDMAGSVGFTDQALAQAMYTVDSAGFHAADSLTILKASAQGAKIEQADLGTTVDAVTTSLVDYHLGADQAATVMSKLVAAVGAGKTTLQDLAGSLHSVTPLAANLGVSLDEVTAAVATMTVHGMSADQATQNLADTMRHLSNPTQTMIAEMGQLGLSSQQVSKDLGDPNVGLHGVIDEIYSAIMNKMGPAGEVLLGTFKQSTSAAGDLAKMVQSMPDQLKNLATGLEDGSVTLDQWKKGIKGLPADLDGMATQFFSLYQKANGFSDALKSGSPAAQTFEAALAKMMGDSTGLNTALMLGGENADRFAANIQTVSGASADASGNVKNWSDVQNTLNQKLSDVEGSLSTLAVKIGDKLLPALKNGADGLASFLDFLDKNKGASDLLAGSLETLSVVGVAAVGLKAGAAVGNVLGFSGAMAGLAGIGFTGIALGIGAVVTQMANLETASDKMSTDNGMIVTTPESIKAASDRWDGLSSAISGVFNTIKLGMTGLGGANDKLNQFESDVANTFGVKLAADVKAGIPQVVAASDAVKNSIIDTFKSNDFQLSGQSSVDDMSAGMKDAVGAAIDAAVTITGSIKSAYEAFDPSPEGKKVAESFGSGIKTGRQAVDAAGQEGLSSLLSILASGGALSAQAGNHTGVSFANGVQSTLPQASGAGRLIVSGVEAPFSGLPSSAYSSGLTTGEMLAYGLAAQQAHVAAAAAGLAATVRSHLPSSPAKVGPLSGSGSPDILGRNIGNMIADGLTSTTSTVGSAMSKLVGGPINVSGSVASSYAVTPGGSQQGRSVNLYATLYVDSKELKNAIQRTTLREERVNTSNGLTRTFTNR